VEVESLYQEPEQGQDTHTWGALEFVDVFMIYRSGPVETVALRGLDLRVAPRELVAVHGPSGSGKSSMLHLAAALDEPSAGDVRALGMPLSRLRAEELDEYRSRKVALVFQSRNLWPTLTAEENVVLSLRLAGTAKAAEEAVSALAAFDLADRRSRRAGALSGGEQQRVAIAAAAARKAPLVLADEPTAELDEHNEELVLAALHRLRDVFGCTVVVVTHSQWVAESADRVVELRDGKAVR
jgi:putative ABC transport system ATP-binding protein